MVIIILCNRPLDLKQVFFKLTVILKSFYYLKLYAFTMTKKMT